MPIRPYVTRSGKKKYQADVADTKRGVARTKRSFNTRKEAEEWLAAVKTEAHDRLLGKRERHTFGEALARYLREESPRKKSGRDDHGNAAALRYPVQDGNHWIRLEHIPLDEMIPALNAWVNDMRLVTRRSYLGNQIFMERPGPTGELAWYFQPDPADGDVPQRRSEVRDPKLLARLNAARGRGPFKTDTLRIRQVLAGRILRLAWKRWGWLEHDIAGKIELEQPAKGRELFLTECELDALTDAAAAATLRNGDPDPKSPHFADLITAAGMIGWRRTNTFFLDWSRVMFPVHDDAGDLAQVGVIWVESDHTKNGEFLAHPIGDELLALLKKRWDLRMTADVDGTHYNLVFHDGSGRPFGDIRCRYRNAKRAAGVRDDFRWHDLRHTWASHLAQRGVSDRDIQELGGWKDQSMVRRYSKLQVEHLLRAVNKAPRDRQ